MTMFLFPNHNNFLVVIRMNYCYYTLRVVQLEFAFSRNNDYLFLEVNMFLIFQKHIHLLRHIRHTVT